MGPVAAAPDPHRPALYLACERSRQIVVLDLATRAFAPLTNLKETPTGLAVSQRSGRLLVTCSGGSNVIISIAPDTGRVLSSWPAGNGVCSPLLTPDGRTLYVCNRYNNTVWAVTSDSGRVIARGVVEREPVSASLSSDGRYLAIANLLPTGAANRPAVGAAVSLLDARSLKTLSTVCLPNGSTSVRAVTFHPQTNICAIVHNIAHFEGVATQVEHGWMNTSALTLLWVGTHRTVTVLLDEARRGAANPSAVAWTPDGSRLCITHAGTHELSIVDWKSLEQKVSTLREGHVIQDFEFLRGIRQRVALGGNGPRALVVAQSFAYVPSFFSDSVTTVDLADGSLSGVVTLSEGASTDLAREGERLFHDATLCHQGWQSCASCHPEGRVDGLNWDLLNDGVGNPKNTKSLVYCCETPPAMSLGGRQTAAEAVRSGLRHVLFANRPESEEDAITAYLQSLKPTPSPWLKNGVLSRSARRGKKLFESARTGCSVCHPPGLFTDLHSYDVGTRAPCDKADDRFDTPTLVELWCTAPYLHDGSAPTVRDVLTTRNPSDRHGRTSCLSRREVDDLCAYLLSL